MTEKFVENQVCKACNANVRPGALFCYNCGSSVAPDLAVETEDVKREVTGTSGLNGNNEKTGSSYFETIDKPIEKPLENPFSAAGKNAPVREKELIVQEKNKAKDTAAIRQKSRSSEGKTLEVVWEAPESRANIWFIIVSLTLVLFAVGILLAMLYIR